MYFSRSDYRRRDIWICIAFCCSSLTTEQTKLFGIILMNGNNFSFSYNYITYFVCLYKTNKNHEKINLKSRIWYPLYVCTICVHSILIIELILVHNEIIRLIITLILYIVFFFCYPYYCQQQQLPKLPFSFYSAWRKKKICMRDLFVICLKLN